MRDREVFMLIVMAVVFIVWALAALAVPVEQP